MKNFIALLSAAVLMGIVSCQKQIDENQFINSPPANVDSTDYKVKTYMEVDSSGVFGSASQTLHLSYDANGRLLTAVSDDSGYRVTYNYVSAGNYTVNVIDDTSFTNEIAYLNDVPLVDSTSQNNDQGDTTLEKYVYDASGKLAQFKDYNYTALGGSQVTDVTEYTYDAEGNATQEVESSGPTTSYEYSAEPNTLDLGLVYEPKTQKKLVSKTTVNDGGSVNIIIHTYTFDTLHRITSERQVAGNGDVVIYSYTY